MPRTRRRANAAKSPTPAPRPASTLKAHPEAWQTALRLADGDPRRLRIEPGGSVLVVNAR